MKHLHIALYISRLKSSRAIFPAKPFWSTRGANIITSSWASGSRARADEMRRNTSFGPLLVRARRLRLTSKNFSFAACVRSLGVDIFFFLYSSRAAVALLSKSLKVGQGISFPARETIPFLGLK